MWSRLYPTDVEAHAHTALYHFIRQDLRAAVADLREEVAEVRERLSALEEQQGTS